MTVCQRVKSSLALGLELPPELAQHRAACPRCAAIEAGFARLDALLRSEPPAPAPPLVLAGVMARVGERRVRERRRARRQLVGLVGAAALVAVSGLGLLELAAPWVGPWFSGLLAPRLDVTGPMNSFVDSPASAWSGLLDTLAAGLTALARLAQLPGGTGATMPVPALPVFLPLLLAPLLILANRSLARPATPYARLP